MGLDSIVMNTWKILIHRIVDNLPCVTKTIGPGSSSVLGGAENEDTNANSHFHVGYPLGFMSQDNQHAYINNHLDFNILYHTDDEWVMVVAYLLLT